MRINVTGNAGAGKTTLSNQIAQELHLPIHNLDSVVWAPHWQKPDPVVKANAIAALCANRSWVIDGVSDTVREQADVIIFLDTPRYVCLYRCIRRCLQWGFATRPELPENCPEIKILFRAIRIVWRFSSVIRPQLLLEAHSNPKFIVCKEASHALTQLRAHFSAC